MSVTERVPEGTTLWAGSQPVPVRPLGHDPHCAFVILTGFHTPGHGFPDNRVVTDWLEQLGAAGFRRVRTSAVATTMTTGLIELGFQQAQDLVLMSAPDRAGVDFRIPRDSKPRRAMRFPRRLPAAVRDEIMTLDADAFGVEWSLDRALLHDALTATGRSQVFVARSRGRLQGFAIVGASGNTGYLQRLAVSANDRRGGVASCLVAASIRWAGMNRCRNTIVNTEYDNHPARSLYEKMGFVVVPQRLSVMTKEL